MINLSVSVILCVHDGAARISTALGGLASQRAEGLSWELVVVDNASSDGSGEVARSLWASLGSPVPLRVLREPRLGLMNARLAGFAAASGDVLVMVDDDNRLESEWLVRCARLMTEQPRVGAAGGWCRLDLKGAMAPPWFESVAHMFAVGPQGSERGDVTETRGLLWGAGLAVRRAALDSLFAIGFKPLVAGRTGYDASGGEDSELCLALRLAGWRLWYEPMLILHHAIEPHRLTWSYVRRLAAASGRVSIRLDPYYWAMRARSLRRIQMTWQWQLAATARRAPLGIVPYESRPGDTAGLAREAARARMIALLSRRGAYDEAVRRVMALPWPMRGGASA